MLGYLVRSDNVGCFLYQEAAKTWGLIGGIMFFQDNGVLDLSKIKAVAFSIS